MKPVEILILNAGSSTVKFKAYAVSESSLEVVLLGQVDDFGAAARAWVHDACGHALWEGGLDAAQGGDATRAVSWLLAWLAPYVQASTLRGVGHRVVHGGAGRIAPVRVDADVLAELEALTPLAPLHQPHNLAPMRAVAELWPDVLQVASFDTAFHRTQPQEAQLYGLPMRYFEQGVRRYGFHGLSYQSIVAQLQQRAPEAVAGRTIVAHLGSGVSMCALMGGRSVASTMGFTALEGCPMGTRSGGLDPGVVLWLARQQHLSMDAIEQLLYRESGLLGLSGISADLRVLQASTDPHARQALSYFTYRLARELGSLVAALGGLDALVFTAGIGENSVAVRAAVCEGAAWLGVRLDAAANAAGAWCISTPASRVAVYKMATDEEAVMAQDVLRVEAAA